MKYKLFTGIFFLVLSFCLFQNNLSAKNKYTLLLNQPDPVRNPLIKWATVSNENNNNQIVFQEQANDNLDYYNIYRNSTSLENGWTLIGHVNSFDNSYFTDLESYPGNLSYQYKVSAVDKCGNELFSKAIKTIYLTIHSNNDTGNLLDWNPSDGINVVAYRIYKGFNPENLTLIDSISATQTEFLDKDLSFDTLFYRVEAVGLVEDSIQDEKKLDKVRTLSNIVSNLLSTKNFDISVNANSYLKLYPNPVKNSVLVAFPFDSTQQYVMSIIDLMGKTVYQQPVYSGEMLLDRNNLKDGCYILQIAGKQVYRKKMIVEL